jgi:hypothetical protein
VVPVGAPDRKDVVAVLVAGLSPQLQLDDGYRRFLDLVADQLAILMAAPRARRPTICSICRESRELPFSGRAWT